DGACDRGAADERPLPRAAAADQRAAGRDVARSAGYAAAALGTRSHPHSEPALFRRDPEDVRRPGAGGDAARGDGVGASARIRSGVVGQHDRRVDQRGAALVRPRGGAVTRTYVQVIVLQAAVIAVLWWLGRVFS